MPIGTALTVKTDQVLPDGLLSQTVLFLHILDDTQQEIDILKFSIPVLKKQKSNFVFAKQGYVNLS